MKTDKGRKMRKMNFRKEHDLCERVYMGWSDIATLIAVGCGDQGIKAEPILFGEDSDYGAYLSGKETEIPDYYHKVFECDYWLRIYDDIECEFDTDRYNGEGERDYQHFTIYRAGSVGMIIQVE